MSKAKPEIRTITRLVPPSGNLVQGQSELAINPELARIANQMIGESHNHYSPSEGTKELRRAVAGKIATINNIKVDPDATPLELMITPGATGGLIAIAQVYLRGASALAFEPYYPYHGKILDELGGKMEIMNLHGENLELDEHELRNTCRRLKDRANFPLKAIIACTPANPTGKVFTQTELEMIANVCHEFDLLCISDEVYEHYVIGEHPHTPIATLPGMWERTISTNSFSKSWNISGWRLGYTYGHGSLVGKLNYSNSIFYVCSPTPLQLALAKVLMATPTYYEDLRANFSSKRLRATKALESVGFKIYDSGSAFYLWARIPEGFGDAMQLNDLLMRGGVGAVPGSAFADSDDWDNYMRICIAREDDVLDGALQKVKTVLGSA